MQNTRSQSPDDLKRILTEAGRKIAAGIEPAEFLKWFGTSIPGIAPEFARAMAQADSGTGAMLYCMGRVLWNAMPQPSNHYRSRALPTPARNGRCPCGSGKKYKQCCATLNPPDHLFGSLNLLRFVLDSETKASLKRIDTRLMEPASLDDVACQWAAEGNFEKALLLLEPLFDPGAKFPKHAELLLDTLFDIWPAHHKPMRRSKLAERLASDTNPAVACTALHRCIMMLADSGDMEEAWKRFHAGMREYPNEVNFAALEITLLLVEGRQDDASRRVEFWVAKLRRLGRQYHDYADRIQAMVQLGDNHDELERIRGESPLLDELIKLIESYPVQMSCYKKHAAGNEQSVLLEPTSALRQAEQYWAEDVGGEKPSLVDLYSADEPLGVEQILPMLEENPVLLNSFDVLDDIAESLDKMVDAWPVLAPVLRLVLQRAETLLLGGLTGTKPDAWVSTDTWVDVLPEIDCVMPWSYMENRPALRLVARHIYHLQQRSVGSTEHWLPRAQLMLSINPDDNHAFRELVSSELLRQQKPVEALRLLELYPDDFLGDVLMNRTLALYCLDRRDEAAIELRKGGSTFREIRKDITQENVDRPKDIDYDAIGVGSREEAWLYRQAMRSTWRNAGAIDWLKQEPVPRKKPPPALVRQDTHRDNAGKLDVSENTRSAAEAADSYSQEADRYFATLQPLSRSELQHCLDNVAPHGPWLLGMTLAAAMTPGGGFAVQRLYRPVLERFGHAGIADDEAQDISVDMPTGNVRYDQALANFVALYQHFLVRLDRTPYALNKTDLAGTGGDDKPDGTPLDWVRTDLSIVSLAADEPCRALVSGVIAAIDGNPRGWSSIPKGPRNSVIGPLRLMAATTKDASDSDDTDLFNSSQLLPDDDVFQMSADECLSRITELVKLAKFAFRGRRS